MEDGNRMGDDILRMKRPDFLTNPEQIIKDLQEVLDALKEDEEPHHGS